jgi:GT2 family glycosyltransferase
MSAEIIIPLEDEVSSRVTRQRSDSAADRRTVRVTAIVTAFKRIGPALETLRRIQACQPAPDEVLVHIDGNQTVCTDAVREAFPDINLLVSYESIGPGGGRNKLIHQARNEIVASFDDDSFPMDADYFDRVLTLFAKFPDAAVLCATVCHQGETAAPASGSARWVADFIGCGCVYRRSAFLTTSGYVPLTVAYGMEEVDLALRLFANEKRVLRTSWLRVFHDTKLEHHSNPEIVAAGIANLALLAYLRYPLSMLPLGAAQCLNRIRWLVNHGRLKGILRGIWMIPIYLFSRRHLRDPLPRATLWSFLKLRRQGKEITSSEVVSSIDLKF